MMLRFYAFLVAGLCCLACRCAETAAPLNVAECGADPTGRSDCTQVLQGLHARKVPLFYPNGTYRFNGETLDFSGGVVFESNDGVVIRNDLSSQPVVVFDDSGRLIGLQQNHLEQDERVLGPKGVMRSGTLVPPPLSRAESVTAVDVIAHWYNDGGLECRRKGGGWIGWYYWSWAFHNSVLSGGRQGASYDAARHPLLGFYRGDDPVVLDWQCFWLAEYGVKAVTLCAGSIDYEHWKQPDGNGHWLYQLFHHVPNFQSLQYILWVPTPWAKATLENQRKVEADWMQAIERVYLHHENFYALEVAGKRFPVLYMFEGAALRGVFDNYSGSAKTDAFLQRIAERFKAAGYGGVALFVRHPAAGNLLNRVALERQGVLYLDASYADDYGMGDTYSARVGSFAPPIAPRTIINVCTSKDSHAPHPSKWVCPGSTPALFGDLVKRAVAHVQTNRMMRIITCYNVAEWAEGGPGLQPEMRDRFGYLEALRDAVALPAGEEPRNNHVIEE